MATTTFNVKDVEGNDVSFYYISETPSISGSFGIPNERYEELVNEVQKIMKPREEDDQIMETNPNGTTIIDRIRVESFELANNIQEVILVANILGQWYGQISARNEILEKMKFLSHIKEMIQ